MPFEDGKPDLAIPSGGHFEDEPGGFKASAKQIIGQTIKGAGQAAGDYLPFVGPDNALKRYGQEVVDANPTSVGSLADIADRPWMAIKEGAGNAATSIPSVLGARAAGMGITAAAPLAGPLAPLVAALGQGVAWGGPALMAALPSYGGIREDQIKDDATNQDSFKAKATALLGAGAVGAIEVAFGPQNWALLLTTKKGQAELAKKFAFKSAPANIAKGVVGGALVEGGEELVQNPIEQMSAFQDPRTPENVEKTVFGGAMGAIGGGVVGGGFGAAAHVAKPQFTPHEELLNKTAETVIATRNAENKLTTEATNDRQNQRTAAGKAPAKAAPAAAEEADTAGQAVLTDELAREGEIDDRQNIQGIPGQEREGQEPVQAGTEQGRGAEAVETGGILQAQGPDRQLVPQAISGVVQESSAFANREQPVVVNDTSAAPVAEQAESRQPAPGEALPAPTTTIPAKPVAQQEAAKAQPLAIRQQLFVEAEGRRYPVDSFEDASSKWEQFRLASVKAGAGGSEVPRATIVDQTGKPVAKISYNGRIWAPGEWKPGDKPLYDPMAKGETKAPPALPKKSGIIPDTAQKSGPDSSAATIAAREPWQMMREEYAQSRERAYVEKRGGQVPAKAAQSVNMAADKQHGRLVREAVAKGKPVPNAVLADYPDLQQNVGISVQLSSVQKSPELSTPVEQKQGTINLPKIGMSIPISGPIAPETGARPAGKILGADVRKISDVNLGRFAKNKTVRIADLAKAELAWRKAQIKPAPPQYLAEHTGMPVGGFYATDREGKTIGQTDKGVRRFKTAEQADAWARQYLSKQEKIKPAAPVAEATKPESATRAEKAGLHVAKPDVFDKFAPWVGNQLKESEAKGEIAILTVGVSRDHTIYSKGQRSSFNSDGSKQGDIVVESSSNDPASIVMRTRDEGDIIAMTSAARAEIDKRRTEFEAKRAEDEAKREADEKASRARFEARDQYFAAIQEVQLPKGIKKDVSFKGTDGKSFTLTGTDYDGLFLHKTLSRDEPYRVTDTKSGGKIADFTSLAHAKDFIRGVIHANLPRTDLMKLSEQDRARWREVVKAHTFGGEAPTYFKPTEPPPAPPVSAPAEKPATTIADHLEAAAKLMREQEKPARTDRIGSTASTPKLDQFVADMTPQEAGSARAALSKTLTFTEDGKETRGELGNAIENKFAEGWRVALTAKGPAFVGADMTGWNKGIIGEYGMQYANWLSSQESAATPEPAPRQDSGGPDVESHSRGEPIFYSALTRSVEALSMRAAPAMGWKSAIKGLVAKGLVKQAEIDAVGLNEFLDLQQGKVTKDQVTAFLQENGVRVEEIVLGTRQGLTSDERQTLRTLERIPNSELTNAQVDEIYRLRELQGEPDLLSGEVQGETKFASYQLPGGTNYRELLLTLPTVVRGDTLPPGYQFVETGQSGYEAFQIQKDGRVAAVGPTREAALQNLKDSLSKFGDVAPFISTHFDQPNILAHIRFNERTDAEGKRVLFVEEIQSDWGQRLKKESPRIEKDGDVFVIKSSQGENLSGGFQDRAAAERAMKAGLGTAQTPVAPFVTKTEAWVGLSLKRMIRYAAENGFDKVAWANGTQQAARYDLSKHVSEIRVIRSPNGGPLNLIAISRDSGRPGIDRMVHESELPDYIGKDAADKLAAMEWTREGAEKYGLQGHQDMKRLAGLDLKVGGEGMKAFYDKIVPNVANDVLKKLGGGRVETTRLDLGETPAHPSATQLLKEQAARSTVPSFTITPAMRETALQGLPMFNRGGQSPGLPASDIRAHIAGITDRLSVPVTVYDDVAAANSDGATLPDDAQGFASKGRIGLVAENIKTLLQAETTLFHELFHVGIRAVAKQAKDANAAFANYTAALNRVAMANPEVRRRAKEWRDKYGAEKAEQFRAAGIEDALEARVRLTSFDEAVADLAGERRGKPITRLNELIAALQRLVRALGFDELASWMESKTDAEVLSLIRSATQAVSKDTVAFGGAMAGETMQSRLDQTQTAEFRKWFGDSVVTDTGKPGGKPLVVYHGTLKELTTIDPELGFETRGAAFLSDNADVASIFTFEREYGELLTQREEEYTDEETGETETEMVDIEPGPVYKVYAKIENPLILDENSEIDPQDFTDDTALQGRVVEQARRGGYDGIIARNVKEGVGDAIERGTTFAIFKATQVKSATDNRGTFDPADPDLMHARAGPSDETQKTLAGSPAGKSAGTWEKLAKTKNRIHEAIDKLSPLGTLPEQEAYLVKRYRALGRLAEVGTEARDLYAAFRDAGEHAPDVYAYLTHKDAQSTIIHNEAIRERAVKAKETLTAVGQKLVDQGLLAKEVFEAHKGEYLPRIYLKHLLDDDAISALSSGKKPSDMGYLKARKDIPEDVRRLILGEITDPAYLVSKAYGTQMRDIALLDWLAEITTERAWVMPESLVEWEGKQVTPFWLKQTAKQVRTQSVRYTEADRAAARAIADRMDEAADTALEGYGGVPEGWKQIPDTPRYGRLRGLIVRSEIHDDIVGSARINPTDASVAEKILGNGGVATKLTQLWKWSKVAANPPAQIRNFVSNGVLLHLSGVKFHMIIPRVIQAIKEIRTNGEHWQIAKKFGVTESTFSAQELFRIEREFLDLQARGASPLSIATAKNLASKVMSFTSDIYQLSESIFKTAKIIDEMTKGKTEEQAMIQAQKWLFDYSLVTPSMRYLRNAPIGAPFVTFYFKALPRLLEVATTHPLRLAPYLAIPYVLTALVASMADVDDDDVDKLKKALPEWLQERGNAHFLPMKDDKGRWVAMDIGYFLPWTMWQELGTEFAKGEFGKAMQSSGLLGGPLPDLIAAVKNNKDPFSKKEIVNEFDPPAKQIASVMGYLYSMSMPTWLTNYGFAGHMYNALNETVDKHGQVKSTEGQAMLRLFGVNLYPINPEQSRADNLRRMKYEIQEEKRRRTMQIRDRNLTPEKRAEVAKEYGELIQKRMKDMVKYAQESRVHPNLSSGARP